jgi:hypothetical protein
MGGATYKGAQSESFAWDEQKSLRALEKQLLELEELKGKRYTEAGQKEDEWTQITEMVFEHSFSSASPNQRNFNFAKNKGTYRIGGMSSMILQSNFDQRVAAFETCVKSAIAGIRLSIPEAQVQGHYDGGDPYAFYKDLKSLVRAATREVFLIDPYLDVQLFDLYVNDIPPAVNIRILSNNVKSQVTTVSQLFSKGRTNFELRSDTTLHDRILFVDDRCWAIGQSVKDAAVKKPTYIVELTATAQTAAIYQPIWNVATSIIKS